ncbi:major facilitator superfamily domain-containing protein 3 [Sceloporus undulatus]|uniref:major facilitator superfamily domain-containing protein 3 n=1 Tax=Sceloporus undulatus TaxID=8520 RepID=UPI001C4D614F|nr:major facilitator superfamily domain-containing protein 3 [Sceloporus undulatus]XP_042320076.1 major facilitator superfamily domain-containing protein 3 [Sceloporus undulatus]XP_042320077.1 major facilitator superfamily domain-containing protein 3 [Sceloporus undulatus]
MKLKYGILGMLYFVQGIPYGLQSGLLPIYFRMVGLSFTKISLTKVLYAPWMFKVMWAPLVDHYFAKKTWLLLTMWGLVLACLACSLMTPEVNFLPVALIFLFMNFCASIQDIAVDGVAIQFLDFEEIGYGNTIQVVAYKLGSVMAGGGLVAFLYHLGWSAIFVYLAVVFTLAIILTSISDLKLRQGRPSVDSFIRVGTVNPWSILRELFHVPDTRWTACFVFIYKLGEQGSISMFPLFLLERHFSPQELGFWNGIVAMAFSIAGSSLGGHLISRRRNPLPLLKTLLIVRFCSLTIQTLLVAFYQDKVTFFEVAAVLSICVQHLIAGLITTVTFSLMMRCSQKAKDSIQATHYSFLATLEVLGKLVFSTLAGTLVDWLGFMSAFGVFLTLSFTSVLYMLRR